jgi:hypothetical protein
LNHNTTYLQKQLDAQDGVIEAHRRLVDAYTRESSIALKDVPDDGYIMQVSERLDELGDQCGSEHISIWSRDVEWWQQGCF